MSDPRIAHEPQPGTVADLKEQLGADFGSLTATRKKKNPYLAISKDGRTEAFGQTREDALQNLIDALAARKTKNV